MTRLRWHPLLLDDMRAQFEIRRVSRHTIALRPLPPALVWADGIAGQPPSECLGDLAAAADRRADDLFCRFLVSRLAVVPVAPVRHVGAIRTLAEAAGHFRYPARAWREARPILAALILAVGLLATLVAWSAGPVLIGAAALLLIGGGK